MLFKVLLLFILLSGPPLEAKEQQGFLLYLPYQGAVNQLNCLVRAVILAEKTNRTLLIPPLYPSKHDRVVNSTIPFSTWFKLEKLLGGVKHIKLADSLPEYVSSCITFGKRRSFDILGSPSREFASKYMIEDLEWHPFPPPPQLTDLANVINRSGNTAC